MRKKEFRKMVLLLAGMALFMGAFWLVLQKLEQVIPDQPTENQQAFLAQPTEAPKVRGTLKLDGKQYEYTDEISNYLLLGIDESGQSADGEQTYQGGMADFLLLAVFNRTQETYAFLQLDRDSMTEVTLLQADGSGYASAEMQLCTAHWYGGSPEQSCENTVDAVSGLLGGVEIDGYYALGMQEISTLNHAVGGVQVTIEDDFSQVDPSLQKGETVVLSDTQAYTFLHGRYGVGDETNASRMKRQRQYLKAVFQKVSEQSAQEPDYIDSLYQQLEDVAVTDITGRSLSRIINRVSEGENQGIKVLEGEYKLGQALDDGIDHVEFYPDEVSLRETLTEIYRLEEKG